MQKNSKSEIIPRIANRNIYYIWKIHLLGYSGIWSELSALGYFYVTTRHKRVKLKHRCKSGTGVAGCPGSSSRQFGCIRTATHTQTLSRVCLPPTHIHTERDAMEMCDKRHPHNCNCIPGKAAHTTFSAYLGPPRPGPFEEDVSVPPVNPVYSSRS